MRNLTVDADYLGTGIRDTFEGQVSPRSLNLPTNLVDRIATWVGNYQPIIPMAPQERDRKLREIEELDKIGLAIARDLQEYLGSNAHVEYFSEGKLQRLPLQGNA